MLLIACGLLPVANCLLATSDIAIEQVVERCASDKDLKVMRLVCDNVLKHLHRGCLEGIPAKDNNTKGIFKLIMSRHIPPHIA